MARSYFENVTDPRLVDYAILSMGAAERRLMYLLDEARRPRSARPPAGRDAETVARHGRRHIKTRFHTMYGERGMPVEFQVVVAYVFGVFLLTLIARVLVLPLRILLRLLYNALVGALLLAFVNFVGGYVLGIYLPINPVTALVVRGFWVFPA